MLVEHQITVVPNKQYAQVAPFVFTMASYHAQ